MLPSTTATDCVAIGLNACRYLTTGAENIGIGRDALKTNTTGSANVAVGRNALDSMDGGHGNTAVGEGAGNAVTTGQYNTLIGRQVGEGLTTGDSNILIGYNAGNTGNGDNQLYIARSNGGAGSAAQWIVGNSAGACTQGNNSSSWTTTSDERLKKNIVDNNKGLAEINQLRVTNFEYRTEDEIDMSEFPLADNAHQVVLGEGNGGLHTGCVAQEVEAVLPECIEVSDFGVKTVNNAPIVWALVNAVKELSAENAAIKERLASLES